MGTKCSPKGPVYSLNQKNVFRFTESHLNFGSGQLTWERQQKNKLEKGWKQRQKMTTEQKRGEVRN